MTNEGRDPAKASPDHSRRSRHIGGVPEFHPRSTLRARHRAKGVPELRARRYSDLTTMGSGTAPPWPEAPVIVYACMTRWHCGGHPRSTATSHVAAQAAAVVSRGRDSNARMAGIPELLGELTGQRRPCARGRVLGNIGAVAGPRDGAGEVRRARAGRSGRTDDGDPFNPGKELTGEPADREIRGVVDGIAGSFDSAGVPYMVKETGAYRPRPRDR